MLQHIWYLNEQGRRKNMEDSLYPAPGKAVSTTRVFLVCDGVGGESKGEIASRIVCDTVGGLLSGHRPGTITKKSIGDACKAAVKQLQAYAVAHPEAERMSTTLTLVCLQGDGAWVAWCGDSRVYLIRNGKVIWRTTDHSIVEQLVQKGEITEEEARHHPQKNIILRSLSAAPAPAEADIHFIKDIKKKDYLLLCTDGLLEKNGPAEFYELLGDHQPEQDKAALFLKNSREGTQDNFSMYLLRFGTGTFTASKKSNLKYLFGLILISCLVALFLIMNKKPGKKPGDPIKVSVKKDTANSTPRSGNLPLPTIPEDTKKDKKPVFIKDTTKK